MLFLNACTSGTACTCRTSCTCNQDPLPHAAPLRLQVECSSACITALVGFHRRYPGHRAAEIARALQRGIKYLKRWVVGGWDTLLRLLARGLLGGGWMQGALQGAAR